MKITVSKNELLGKLRILGKVLQSKNTLPAYNNFLFVINENKNVRITAGEEGGRMTTNIDCQTHDCSNLQFTANAKTLLEALKEIPEQPLVIEISPTSKSVGLNCTYSNGKFSIIGGLGKEYPEMPFINPSTSITLNSSDFLHGIRQVKVCCANDMLRPVLNGVYFDRDIDKITYVASNGNVLGLMENTASHVEKRFSFIIPSRYAQILSIIIPENCELKVTLASSNACFEFDNYCLIFRLIEGRYPNYRSVIPQANDKEALLCRDNFISAARRTAVFSNPNTLAIKLSFSDNLLIQGQDTDYSTSAQEIVNLDTYKGKKIEIGFKSTYLIELLFNISTEKVKISMKEPSTAALLSPVSGEDNMLFLIMPISINF